MTYAETAPEPKKSKSEESLQEAHVWVKQCFESSEEATQNNRAKQERDRDYQDNKQLTPDEVKKLNKRGQPPLTRPFIKRKIDYIVGLEIKKRTDPKCYPRTPKHEQDADGATQALRYAADQADFPRCKTKVTKEFLVEGGPTGAYIGAKKKPNGQIDITAIHLPWDRCFVDPHSRELDYSDATYMGFITWMDEAEAKDQFPDAEDIIAATVNARASNTQTYDDRPRWQKWVDKRKRLRIVEIYYESHGQWTCAQFTESGFLKEPHVSEYIDQDGAPENPIELTSCNVDRDNNRYGEVRQLIDLQDSVNKRVSKLTHLLNVRQARFGRGVKDADKQSRELAKPDGKIVADKDEFEILPTNDLAAGQAQMLQFDLAEMTTAGPNSSLMGKGPEGASGRAILANQQGGQIELEPQMDTLSLWELNCYRKMWNRIRQYWTGEMWLRVTDDERNMRWVGLNAPMTQGDLAEREGIDPKELEAQGIDPNAPAMDPKTGQPMVQNPVGTLDVDIIVERGPDTVTLQQEQFDVLSKVQGIPPDILIELSSLPGKDKVMDRLTGKVGPGGSKPQPPPPPPEVIKAQADAAEKDKDRQLQVQTKVGDRQMEMAKLEAQKEKDARADALAMEKLGLEKMKLELEAQRLQLDAAKLQHDAHAQEADRMFQREQSERDIQVRQSEQESKAKADEAKANQPSDEDMPMLSPETQKMIQAEMVEGVKAKKAAAEQIPQLLVQALQQQAEASQQTSEMLKKFIEVQLMPTKLVVVDGQKMAVKVAA